ncbi:hypothetical protein OF83DRAFT_1160766 [Amylostereum chailletii]|nr:hypothetical protein OF83DRAFT_1160766 [Amylostereum chailletii]
MTRTYFAVPGNICHEYEIDDNGRLIGDPLRGMKPTKRAEEARKASWQRCIDNRPPMLQLRADLRPPPGDTTGKTPLLHFGLPVTMEQYLSCVRKNDLIPDGFSEQQVAGLAMPVVIGHLHKKTKVLVRPQDPLSWEYDSMIALYSNYTQEKVALSEEAERDTIRLIREELGIDEDTQVMWWWDIKHGPG